MNGVTGRMGTNQHLIRSILPLIETGIRGKNTDTLFVPDPVLVGRNDSKLKALSKRTGITKWTTDLDSALSDAANSIYFDATLTATRMANVKKAIDAGKHIYCEKPVAQSTYEALELYRMATEAKIKHGVVQDKLWLPGVQKLNALIQRGFFGRIFAVRGEFGYWVFEGNEVPAQRPSWNYKKEFGGGIIMDMLCHWRYLLDNTFGGVKAVSCFAATHIPKRWDESGEPYNSTAEDAAYATFELEGEIIAHFNSSWDVRVRRDDLLTVQVDGTDGSAVAGLRECWIQPFGATPKPVWNPDIPQSIDFHEHWIKMPDQRGYDNAFKAQWELFLRHVALNEPFPWNLFEGAKGVQLAELAIKSWQARQWMDVPPLKKNPEKR